MAGNILKLVAKHPACTPAMLQATIGCAARSRDYYTPRQELEQNYRECAGREGA
jgi:hypothetical protein